MTTASVITERVAKGIEVLAAVGAAEKTVMPYAMLIAGLVPGAASVLSAIAIAQPYIDRALSAAPQVAAAVRAGAPVIDALQNAGPGIIEHAKAAYAILVNADPTRPETGITGDDVSDEQVAQWFAPVVLGRPMTRAEEELWFSGRTANLA